MYSQYTILLCCTNPSALTSTGPRSINMPTVQWNGLQEGIVMQPHVSGPLLVIVGGMRYDENCTTISDCWIHDLTTMKWKKVICVVHVYQILYVWFWSSATTP